jgi:hypothetical protein
MVGYLVVGNWQVATLRWQPIHSDIHVCCIDESVWVSRGKCQIFWLTRWLRRFKAKKTKILFREQIQKQNPFSQQQQKKTILTIQVFQTMGLKIKNRTYFFCENCVVSKKAKKKKDVRADSLNKSVGTE